MLGQLLEADAQYQLGAAPRPATIALHILQAFEKAANVENNPGTIARQEGWMSSSALRASAAMSEISPPPGCGFPDIRVAE
jgi:hypothetical protein